MKPVVVIIASLLLSGAPAAFSHEGEDHGGEDHAGDDRGAPPPALSQALLPRASAASDEFEMVAVLDGKKLVIYLDRFASNEPVTGAKVEVEGGGLAGIAAESAPGIYGIDAAVLTAAKHPLTIAIDAGDSADLLSATLDNSTPPAALAHDEGWSGWAVGFGAALLGLAGGLLWVIRRKKQSKGVK